MIVVCGSGSRQGRVVIYLKFFLRGSVPILVRPGKYITSVEKREKGMDFNQKSSQVKKEEK